MLTLRKSLESDWKNGGDRHIIVNGVHSISRFLRWLLDESSDPVVEEQLRKNRQALEMKRQKFKEETAA